MFVPINKGSEHNVLAACTKTTGSAVAWQPWFYLLKRCRPQNRKRFLFFKKLVRNQWIIKIARSYERQTPPYIGGMGADDRHMYAVSALGFEPRTNGLKGHCSAVELRARAFCILSRYDALVNVIS